MQTGLASSAWGYERMLRDPGWANFGATLPKTAALEPVQATLLSALEGPGREAVTARARRC